MAAASETRFSAEEIGYLLAGPERAAETAVARLLDAGLVRVSRDGEVSAVHQNHHGAATSIEARILTHLRTPVRFDLVVRTAAHSSETRALHERLREQGLTRTPRVRLKGWWFLLPFGVLMMLAAIQAPWVGVFGVAFLGLSWWVAGAGPVTRAGKAAVKGMTASDTVLAVALHGFRGTIGGLPVAELAKLPGTVVEPLPGRRRKAGSSGAGFGCGAGGSGGGGCSSGSSGCGGGGCGGGGGS